MLFIHVVVVYSQGDVETKHEMFKEVLGCDVLMEAVI